MEPIKRCIREVVGNINIIPNTINVHSVPSVLGSTVCTAIAINDIARNVLAPADSGKEAGDIVADTRFGLHGFGDDVFNGVVDFKKLCAALDRIGYVGPYSVEMIPFSRLPDLVMPDASLAEKMVQQISELKKLG